MHTLTAYSDSSSGESANDEDCNKCSSHGVDKAVKPFKSTETNVNNETRELSVSTTDLPVKTILDEHLHNKQIEATNFFGIENSSSSEDESGQMYPTQGAASTSALPPTAFWLGMSKKDDWEKPETVWRSEEETINREKSLGQLPKRKASHNGDEMTDHTVKRYISSRKKSETSNCHELKDTAAHPVKQKGYFVHPKVSPFLHFSSKSVIPKQMFLDIKAHDGAVNRLQWCKAEYGHLLLSAGMDRTVRVWNVFAYDNKDVQKFTAHTKAVKDCKWVNNGRQVLSASYDRTARLFDVEKGCQLQTFNHAHFVTCLVEHPVNPHLFLSGSLSKIICWDMRCAESQRMVFAYKEPFGQVQDLTFVENGSQFFSCGDLVSRDSADRNIMAWDFRSGVVLSNQIYQERYTCSRLRVHPHEATLMSQSSGGYIALFSTIAPYKIDKYKRLEGHKVEDYNGVGFDISPDGRFVVSGSCDGRLAFYDYHRGKMARRLSMEKSVCLDVAWNPVLPSTVAVSTWGGLVRIYH